MRPGQHAARAGDLNQVGRLLLGLPLGLSMADSSSPRALAPGDFGIGRLFERVRDAVVVADAAASGRIVLWNPAAEKLFGYSASEVLGLPVEVLIPQRLKPRHRAGLVGYLATGHGALIDEGAVVEVPAVRKSGEEIMVELSLSPIEDASVGGQFVLATIRDVSERARMRAETARGLKELEALYEADETLHRSLRLEDVLQALVDVTHEILEADSTTLVVWDAQHERLIPGATRGMRSETVARISFALGDAITGQVALIKQPIAVEDVAHDTRVDHRITDPEGIRALLQVPIQIDGEVFGVFGVNYGHEHRFTGAEERLLVALAERAANAIANARKYEHAQYAATLEERQRLARDLHDAVTQTLFAAGLSAEALQGIWAADPDLGQQCLREVRRLIWGALAETRTMLVELRPSALTETDLHELLQQLVQAAAARVPALETVVTVDGDHRITPELQVGLYRVAQEALNNIVKHADARHVEVHLSRRPDRVELSVSDDGRGFDPHSIPAGHLGIGIMRERVEAIGGILSIDTEPGGGSCLRVVWNPASGALRHLQGME